MVRIAHLYPEELCLYGENGNIKALVYALKEKGIDSSIINVSKGDKLELDTYDFIYIGSGLEKNLGRIKERLIPYKEDFLRYIKLDKPILITGNALAIFDFLDKYEIEEYKEYKVADVVATSSICSGNIYGFQNTKYMIKSTNHLLFQMINGYGNQNLGMEGYHEHEMVVTSIIGPILARNISLTNYFVNVIIEATR